LIFFALTLGAALPSEATTLVGKSETRKDIDRFYEMAASGEDYDAAVDSIVDYVERGDVDISDRRYALLKLGQLGVPKLKDYLRDVAFEDIELADGRQLQAHANLAYWQTLYAEATDANDEERVLASALEATLRVRIGLQKERSRDVRASIVRGWAADQLCDIGKSEYLDKIAWSLDQYNTNERAQKRIELCRWQMELLNKFSSRLATMEHIVLNDDPTDQADLTRWALRELHEMESTEADEVLFAHIVWARGKLESPDVEPNTDYALTVLQAASHLGRRNWTLEDYFERGFDPADRALIDMIVIASPSGRAPPCR
jgi:hypothetical protein